MNLNPGQINKIYQEMKQLQQQNKQPINRDELEHLIEKIYLSIEEELRAAAYYRALAEAAPDQFAADMLSEFANDEREHAYQLQRAYERITGDNYSPPHEEYEFELTAEDYEEALEKRVLEETADFKKYKDYYLMTNNQYLRDIFFNAMHDESYHATRELYLLHMAGMGMMNV
jgi:rubrerythrin